MAKLIKVRACITFDLHEANEVEDFLGQLLIDRNLKYSDPAVHSGLLKIVRAINNTATKSVLEEYSNNNQVELLSSEEAGSDPALDCFTLYPRGE